MRSPSAAAVGAPIAANIWLLLILLGLTDATPNILAQTPEAQTPEAQAPEDRLLAAKEDPDKSTFTISERCVDNDDGTALAGVLVRLYRIDGRTAPPVEIASTVTDAEGRYTFTGLVPPRPEDYLDRLNYGVFGFADDRPIGVSFFHFDGQQEVAELRMARDKATLSGTVIDAAGRPVAGAVVLPYFVRGRPVPSLLSSTTDAEGRFQLDGIGAFKWPGGKPVASSFVVLHPDYPETQGTATSLPADVIVTLPTGCAVAGTVIDSVTGQPAAGAVVTARRFDEWGESEVATDTAGRFRLVVPEGRSDFLADTKDRVCIAVTGQECLAGDKIELPPFTLVGGGFISGQVTALIRAVPRTLLPSSSDFGLIVGDQELATFMQTHDLDPGQRTTYFDLGRPGREIVGALHGLTQQTFEDADLFSMLLSPDPRRQVLQRRIYGRQAQRWQTWWETNWRNFTDDATYRKVHLTLAEEPVPPAPAPEALGKTARLRGEWSGAVLSPAIQDGQHAWHFYDLDTGYRPSWPTHIPRDEASPDAKQLADWASQNGVDLMCISRRALDGTETYVLRALGMKVWEISQRDLRNLDTLIAAGALPKGRPVGELLMHYDAESKRLVPDANAAFVFITREGNMGLIETTDRITRTADVTGLAAGNSTSGVGFHLGVQFNLKAIVP